MRKEFSLRKIQDQHSGESGYSDEHEDEDDKISKTERFDRNLLMFDRTTSPTFIERRQSESPILHDFNRLYIFSRAQSEPPPNLIKSVSMGALEVFDLIMDPIPCEESATQSRHEDVSQEILVVQSPPVIHNYDKKNPPKVKTNLRKNKRKKDKNGRKVETAEEMYQRLMGALNGEISTASNTTIDEDELELDNVEDIPLDPVPECSQNIQHPVSEQHREDCENMMTEKNSVDEDNQHPVNKNDEKIEISQEPSTSAGLTTTEMDYLQRREARLARLEAESKEFYEKMTRAKEKSVQLDNKLNNVHQNFLDRQKEQTKSEDDSDDHVGNVDEPKTNQSDKEDDDDGKS